MSLNFEKSSGEIWQPVSDLMSVLMMVFILIAISFMVKVAVDKENMQEVAESYIELQNNLYNDLYEEFKYDLIRWDAELDKDNLSIRFRSPEIIFDLGSSKVKEEFVSILEDFIPRFIGILYSEEYRNDIEEIRIEGHTSKYWRAQTSPSEAYILNMGLSQDRTRNVLEIALEQIADESTSTWTQTFLTANGLSSSRPFIESDGTENQELSRRVEFRVKTNAENRIAEILLNR
jgi:outer membrane protein OmpA-like peptidoglycan-associated protein